MNMWQSILIPIIDFGNEGEIPLNFIARLNSSVKYTAKFHVLGTAAIDAMTL